MQFMVDCAVILNHGMVKGVSQRNLRVLKYRGPSFEENEFPFVIGRAGLEVAGARALGCADVNVTNERVSSGVERLDTMLGGGYYRGANVLISGISGTEKTTLSGAFAAANLLARIGADHFAVVFPELTNESDLGRRIEQSMEAFLQYPFTLNGAAFLSSLSYLSKLPVDTLKIDGSFVNNMTDGPQGLLLVSTIINLAHSLKLTVVAEGVESTEQSDTLRSLGCDEMQGFVFSKPIPCELFESRYLPAAP
jgi:hypothetical protein